MGIEIRRNVTGYGDERKGNMVLADYKVTYPSGQVRQKRLNDDDADKLKERLGSKGKVERVQTVQQMSESGVGVSAADVSRDPNNKTVRQRRSSE